MQIFNLFQCQEIMESKIQKRLIEQISKAYCLYFMAINQFVFTISLGRLLRHT